MRHHEELDEVSAPVDVHELAYQFKCLRAVSINDISVVVGSLFDSLAFRNLLIGSGSSVQSWEGRQRQFHKFVTESSKCLYREENGG